MGFVRFRGKKIFYNRVGKGPALVLLHGFTESSAIWDDFRNRLKKHFSVICVDLPGHGLSDVTGPVHTMEDMAAGIKRVLDELDVSKCVLLGHSMGGYVALAFAEKFAPRLNGLVLFHSSPLADTPEARVNRDRAIEVVMNSHAPFLLNFIPDLFAPEHVKKFKHEIKTLQEAAVGFMTSEGICACLRGMKERPDRTHVLRDAKYPVLMIFGKKDKRVPLDAVLPLAALPARGYAAVFDIGHMGYIEAKDETLAAVRNFAAGVS